MDESESDPSCVTTTNEFPVLITNVILQTLFQLNEKIAAAGPNAQLSIWLETAILLVIF